jgi:hypothetical protein
LSTEKRIESKARNHPVRVRLLVAVGVAGVAAWLTWSATTLSGLPDIGEPFDVEAFCRPIPEETNAFVLYKEANGRLGKEPKDVEGIWETAAEPERRWLAENREALEIWRRGTERPDALYVSARTANVATLLPVIQGQRTFSKLAMLEGSRLEAEGNFEGALDWYLAILRSSRHTGKRGTAIERLVGIAIYSVAAKRLTNLVARPEVGAPTIRRALESALAIDAMTPPLSDLVKCEYLYFVNSIEDPALQDPSQLMSPAPEYTKTGLGKAYFRMRRVFQKEPERSRRVYRLIIANWLAYCDRPAAKRPPMAKNPAPAVAKATPATSVPDLFEPEATAPDSLRALPPAEIARWFHTTIHAEIFLPAFGAIERAIIHERSVRASLLISLANELYAREHGQPPATVEELVGPYLKTMPEGYGTAK